MNAALERFRRVVRRSFPHLKRMAGFALVPGLSFLASLFILPAIASRFGADGWIAVGLGQSVGALAGIVVGLDWPISGAQSVAESEGRRRRALYFQSLRTRSVAFISIAVPVGMCVGLLSDPEFRLETVLFFAATAMNGFTASWYFAGTGEPRFLIRNEGAVRLGAYAISFAGIALFNAPLAFYAVMLCIAGVLMPVATAFTVSGSHGKLRQDWNDSKALPSKPVPEQVFAAGSRLLSQAYSYAGMSVVSISSPGSLATYASIDQVQKAVNNGLGALPAAFQSWVGSPRNAHDRVRRVSLATRASIVGCIPLAVLLYFTLPLLQHYLFSGKAPLSPTSVVLCSVVVSLNLLSQLLQFLSVVPLGKEMRVYPVLAVSGALGLFLLLTLVPHFGTLGALLALAGAGVVQVACFLSIHCRAIRSLKR